jgi:hypothetical protein
MLVYANGGEPNATYTVESKGNVIIITSEDQYVTALTFVHFIHKKKFQRKADSVFLEQMQI